ncbi:Gfo/Idh/MocA family oxidoreductase [Belliella kenyensis]|uniref:Gfo/Idh/MocA family oxidoreductase n=1 Tax=Belliella kenyensis TaxID=1472724 RepID=A0ABV8EQ74_9BACT|nr:Gfo/Idh/MocA family oxidoreductase [Belliella kenyensis]MCH7402526.1 Gfo/Idh/MocA family oxidoreductase [Belliella kenyensis]MDN3603324.1 Gfo/Idh/MocA family oxidoreductase [Belliella kenyensis]
MNPIRTALVGFGNVGEKTHAPLIQACPYLELCAVVERSQQKSKVKYPHVEVYRSLEALLEADAADLMVIVTPNDLHFEQAKLCLERGKHVLVDKPVTISSQEAMILKRIAKENGRVLSVFQNRRLDGDFKTVQKLIYEEKLGKLVHFESHFDRFRPQISDNWREKDNLGNGITYDLGTHLIDQAVCLFGMPKWVKAEIRVQRANAIADDFFDIILGYDSPYVRLTASVLSNAPMPKFLLQGYKGSYIKYGLDVQEKALKAGIAPKGDDWGVEDASAWGKVYFADKIEPIQTERGDYRDFYSNLAKSIRGEETLMVKMDEAINVLKIIESAFESNESGQKIVI